MRGDVCDWMDYFCLFFAEALAQEAYAFPRLGKMVVPGCQKLSCILIREKYFPSALHMLYQHSCYVCFVFRSLNISAGLGMRVSAA